MRGETVICAWTITSDHRAKGGLMVSHVRYTRIVTDSLNFDQHVGPRLEQEFA